MPEQDTFKGKSIIVSDDPDFTPDENFSGFSVSPQDAEKMQAAGMVRTVEITNKLNRAANTRRKSRAARKAAKKAKRHNRR